MRLLVDRLGETAAELWTDEDTVEIQVSRERIVDALRTLRDDPDFGFFFLADAAAVDYGVDATASRSSTTSTRTVIRPGSAFACRWNAAIPRAPSVTGIWPGAMFHEREMYDMMGIVFEGNRDLRRIYMSPDYRSFPQRKDFLLPDDAADSPAAGVNPLERPETWDLSVFTRELTSAGATYAPTSSSRGGPCGGLPAGR